MTHQASLALTDARVSDPTPALLPPRTRTALPDAAGGTGSRWAGRCAGWWAARGRAAAWPVLGLLALVAVWHLGVRAVQQTAPMAAQLAPVPTLDTLVQLLQSPTLWGHAGASLRRVLVGLGLAALVGVPLGLLMGRSRWFESASGGAFQLLRMISPLSWMPLVVMVLGVGDAPIYFLLAFAAVWPIALNTAVGVRSIDAQWLQLTSSLSATRWETLIHLVVPAVVGHVLTGLRLAVGVVWVVLVPCEMLGVSQGLGYFILDTRDRLAYSELMAAVVFIGMLGWGLDAAARALHRAWAHG